MEGQLAPAQRQQVKQHLAQCGECRLELERISEVVHLLETAACDFEQRTSIDVRADVIKNIRAAGPARAARRDRVIIAPRPVLSPAFWKLGWAVAAALAVFVVWLQFQPEVGDRPTGPIEIASPAPDTDVLQPPSTTDSPPPVEVDPVPAPVPVQPPPIPFVPLEPPVEEPEEEPPPEGFRIPKFAEVVDALKDSLDQNEEAIQQLAEWMELSEDEARRLLEENPGDPAIAYTASQVLPREEALAAMEEAADQAPDQPLVFVQLASLYAQDPADSDAALDSLAQVGALDPENGLADYLQARLLLEKGDVEGARTALSEAGNKPYLDNYDRERNQYEAATFAQRGFDAGSAALLASAVPDDGYYSDLNGFAQEAIDYGYALTESGKFELARELYQAVGKLGERMYNDAFFTNAAILGVEIQRMALDALTTLVDFTGEFFLLDFISGQLSVLGSQLGTLQAVAQGIVQVMQNLVSLDAWVEFAENLLSGGELAVDAGG